MILPNISHLNFVILSDNWLNGEGEVGVGEWLFLQREVPPFSVDGFEAMM